MVKRRGREAQKQCSAQITQFTAGNCVEDAQFRMFNSEVIKKPKGESKYNT
jgi:hypothetical protein